MSLTKLIKAPIKLLRKDVITFLVIRRHDLGILEDKLRYLAVKPTASIFVLRQKIWHLLDLPDYCEEMIILKCDDKELPLTELRNGNSPHHPYILEVWSPEPRLPTTKCVWNNMLTLGDSENYIVNSKHSEVTAEKLGRNCNGDDDNSAISTETIALNGFTYTDNKRLNVISSADYKKSDITCRMSTTSILKLKGRKKQDSFTNILLKIQSDLCTLSTKLSNLENRIPL